MNVFLLSLIVKRIEGLMTRFSLLPIKSPLLSSEQNETLVKLSKKVLDTYFTFLQAVGIAPPEYRYTENKVVKKISHLTDANKNFDDIDKRLFPLLTVPLESAIIPVNIHIRKQEELILYTGFGITQIKDVSTTFFLHELSISTVSVEYNRIYLRYLEEILLNYSSSKFPHLKKLVASYDQKNYNQFQRDCKEYFGDTFYQFYNKIRMLDALEDIMLSGLSLRDTAIKNNFSSYNNMYVLFCKKYKFPVGSIPRLFNKISK